jgi:hypothetical protein
VTAARAGGDDEGGNSVDSIVEEFTGLATIAASTAVERTTPVCALP